MSEANGDNLDILIRKLDGVRIGRIGISKCTAVNDAWLTVYDWEYYASGTAENGSGFGDEQLSFGPAELLTFCREVIRRANSAILSSKQEERE